MGLNIEARLMIDGFSRPIKLRLTDGEDVEIDESTGRTCFKGVKFSLMPQEINGKIGYEDEIEGWVPYDFIGPVYPIANVYISNDLLLRRFVLSEEVEVPVDGNSSWVDVYDVERLYDYNTVHGERKRDGLLEVFNMDGSDATLTISLSMSLAMW